MIEIVVGLIIGLVLGLTGAGGSVFAVPLLVLTTSVAVSDAMGLALGTVAVTTLYATVAKALNQHRVQTHLGQQANHSGKILWAPALILSVAGALTAPIGKWLSTLFTDQTLMIGFAAVAVIISIRMWFQATHSPIDSTIVRADMSPVNGQPTNMVCRLSPTGQFQLKFRCVSGLMLGGLIIGVASGLFGVGGGFLIVPLLLYLSDLTMRTAVGTSLAIIAAVSSSGFASYLFFTWHANSEMGTQGFNTVTFLKLTFASLFALILSQKISAKIAGPTLQKIFSITLILLCLVTVITQ